MIDATELKIPIFKIVSSDLAQKCHYLGNEHKKVIFCIINVYNCPKDYILNFVYFHIANLRSNRHFAYNAAIYSSKLEMESEQQNKKF